MPVIDLVDVEGAVLTYLTAYPGLTGDGNPLAGGLHIGTPRIPATGAIAELEVIAPVTADDIAHSARAAFTVTAAGGRQRAREVAEHACRSLASAVLALTGSNVIVQTRRGDWVRILVSGQPSGPIHGGDTGGTSVYLFDATVMLQPTTAP